MEPVVPPAVDAAAVGEIVDDVQPHLASLRSILSSAAEQQVADNLHVGKWKRWVSVTPYRQHFPDRIRGSIFRVPTHDDMSAGKLRKRQALYKLH
jgi:hypothetical protein